MHCQRWPPCEGPWDGQWLLLFMPVPGFFPDELDILALLMMEGTPLHDIPALFSFEGR